MENYMFWKNLLCKFLFVEKTHSAEFCQQVREVLTMLFESLTILYREEEEVMHNSNTPIGQKEAFLFYYELKLEEIKAEFEQIEKSFA